MTRGNQSTLYSPPHGGGGNYSQFFPIYKSGNYLLELLYNGGLVEAEEVVIQPGPPDAYLSIVDGSGLGNSKLSFAGCDYQASPGSRLLAAGVSYTLNIKVRDAWNNSCEHATGASWSARFASHVSSTLHVRRGDVDVVFVPRRVGHDLPFSLAVDGLPLFDTSVTIVPGPPADLVVSLLNNEGRAGANVTLQALLVDSEGNPLSCCCAAMQRTLAFADQDGQTSTTVAHSVYHSDHEEIIAALPAIPGFYSVSMQAADLRRSVPSLLVRAGAIDPAGSYLRMAKSRSTGSIDLSLVMTDRFNNSVPSLASITNITIIPPADIAVSVGALDILITATNFTRSGEHLVYISADFEPISTYPFRFEAILNEPVTLSPRITSYTALIAIGAACAACGIVFVAGFCGCERLRAVARGSFPRVRPFPLKRQLL
jgi:hypothetical protein